MHNNIQFPWAKPNGNNKHMIAIQSYVHKIHSSDWHWIEIVSLRDAQCLSLTRNAYITTFDIGLNFNFSEFQLGYDIWIFLLKSRNFFKSLTTWVEKRGYVAFVPLPLVQGGIIFFESVFIYKMLSCIELTHLQLQRWILR